MKTFFRASLLAIVCATPVMGIAQAQTAQIALGGLKADTTRPVEVTADALTLDQASGAATFTGNVVISQGDMRLGAGEVTVEYKKAADGKQGGISRLNASGGVTLATSAEAAEAQEAVYTVDDGLVVMTGSVLLTQGPNTISGEKLTLNLKAGTGAMEGRVKTVLNPKGGN